jgi:hypothetical protein
MRLFSASHGTTRGVGGALALIVLGGLTIALTWLLLARKEAFRAQYHISQMAVSRTGFTAVSVSKRGAMSAPISSNNGLEMAQKRAGKVRLDPVAQTGAAQYQTSESRRDDRRLMLRIAAGLGLAYVGFVAWWIWATRLRSRPPRIDMRRRID